MQIINNIMTHCQEGNVTYMLLIFTAACFTITQD